MRKWRWLMLITVVALVIAAAYIAGTSQQARTGAADANAADAAAYDYEATAVIVRQMDAAGQLQYQLQAERVTQLPQNGAIAAHQLTMHYDPPRGQGNSGDRWTLTAETAQLPESSDVVELQGKVRVSGKPGNSGLPATFTTERLDYNMKTQDLRSDDPVEFHWGGSRVAGKGLRANIKLGTVELESQVNGQLSP